MVDNPVTSKEIRLTNLLNKKKLIAITMVIWNFRTVLYVLGTVKDIWGTQITHLAQNLRSSPIYAIVTRRFDDHKGSCSCICKNADSNVSQLSFQPIMGFPRPMIGLHTQLMSYAQRVAACQYFVPLSSNPSKSLGLKKYFCIRLKRPLITYHLLSDPLSKETLPTVLYYSIPEHKIDL